MGAPDHLIGHSIGEVAAARPECSCCRRRDAVAARGRLDESVAGGAMLSVRAGAGRPGVLRELGVLAAVNGPASVVPSGRRTPSREARPHWSTCDRGCRCPTPSTPASLDPVLDEFARVCAGLDFRPAALPVISTPRRADLGA
ncbi:hypothetical protein K7G98_00545 [Saccharothrix sp. MB29]|nr:hypothetical protein [Saccharothrix sp. MB29]